MNPARTWTRLWFAPATTTPLGIVRIMVGLVLLSTYGPTSSELFALYGPDGWITREAAREVWTSPWNQSLMFYFDAPWQWVAFHVLFLLAIAAFSLGWHTRFVKWIVLIGHLSYVARNPVLYYGLDGILASLLFLLCLAPSGGALSLDRVRAVRRHKQTDLAAQPPPATSRFGFACLRLMQFQMAVFFLFAGIEKLQGESWWHGYALWIALTNFEYANIPIGWLARNFWIVNLLGYYTILLEIAYPFLIWGQRTRPWLLAGAIVLHLGIAAMLGLYAFSFAMIAGHLSFLRPEWLSRLGEKWKNRIGPMEMIYDGDCGFCKRSMAWLLAFDGLHQISIRDYRRDPSPVVPSELVDKALYTVLPDGRALPGFDAYRHVVVRVPGLWWLIPFFHVPVLSPFFGRRIYAWVAAHRHQISSACGLPERPEP